MVNPTQSAFRIVALGDSVMWGQGLPRSQKIHMKVAAALQAQNPTLAIKTRLLAHSGAIIGDPDDRANPLPLAGPYGGEVPITHPTLFQQAQRGFGARKRSPDVHLLLVCGGINDVHLSHLLNPLDDSLEARMELFARRFKALVETLAYGYPNAKIIFTGYYPFFSSASQRSLIALGMAALGFGIAGLPGVIGGLVLDALTIEQVLQRSDWFHKTIHRRMQDVIEQWVAIAPELGARLFFADPGFTAQNAMFAPETLLYGINPDLSPQDPPQIAAGRAKVCAAYNDQLDPLERLGCPRASAGHPSPAGAQRYADAILDQIRFALPVLFAGEGK